MSRCVSTRSVTSSSDGRADRAKNCCPPITVDCFNSERRKFPLEAHVKLLILASSGGPVTSSASTGRGSRGPRAVFDISRRGGGSALVGMDMPNGGEHDG